MVRENVSAGDEAADLRQRRQIGLPVLPPMIALIEIALFFVPITLIEIFEPTLLDITTWQPHPFWFPVLLLSLQYGTVSGLLTASIAIGVSAFFGFPEQEVGENHFNYLLRIWLQPVLWIAVAVVLGQFRLRQISERADLQQRLDEVNSQRKALADHAENFRLRCERLERGLASRQPGDAQALIDSLLDLQAADGQQAGDSCLNSIELVAAGAEASCYLMTDAGLELLVARGSRGADAVGRHFGRGSPLYQAIAEEARSLSALAEADAVALGTHGLAAVPILAPAGDRVLGMLKIDFAPAATLTRDLTDRLMLIAAQAVPAVQRLNGNATGAAGLVVSAQSDLAGRRPRRRQPWRSARHGEERSASTARGGQSRLPASV